MMMMMMMIMMMMMMMMMIPLPWLDHSQLRSKQRGGDSVPVTTRQLESLIRLAEARARMDLREEVTREDAQDAVAVVRETIIFDTLTDLIGGTEGLGGPSGHAPGPPRVGAATSKRPSHNKVLKDFQQWLEYEEQQLSKAVWSMADLREAFRRSKIQNSRDSVEELVDALNMVGIILKTAGGYKLASSTMAMSQRANDYSNNYGQSQLSSANDHGAWL